MTITSIGSPSAVPVPCASSEHEASRPFYTASMSRLYDDPFGAVRLALGPSCYTAKPQTTDSSVTASGVNENAPQPSPRQYPSARRSNVWHHPSTDSIPAVENASETITVNHPTPAAAEQGHLTSLRAESAK